MFFKVKNLELRKTSQMPRRCSMGFKNDCKENNRENFKGVRASRFNVLNSNDNILIVYCNLQRHFVTNISFVFADILKGL